MRWVSVIECFPNGSLSLSVVPFHRRIPTSLVRRFLPVRLLFDCFEPPREFVYGTCLPWGEHIFLWQYRFHFTVRFRWENDQIDFVRSRSWVGAEREFLTSCASVRYQLIQYVTRIDLWTVRMWDIDDLRWDEWENIWSDLLDLFAVMFVEGHPNRFHWCHLSEVGHAQLAWQ